MPSSKNYVRDYQQEAKTAKARGEDKDRAKRNAARRQMERDGRAHKGDGKDVDHKHHLATGGSNASSNLRMRPASANRADNGHHKGEKK